MTLTTTYDFSPLDDVIKSVIAPNADQVDQSGQFPRHGIDALTKAGLLGLISAKDVGGAGYGIFEATQVVEKIGRACSSTAMIMCMHYAGTAVLENCGPQDIRREIAAGKHLTTLAFSEKGSRSHFWAPLSTAIKDGDNFKLAAKKSWVTAANHADSYVWSSQAVAKDAGVSLWLMPKNNAGLAVSSSFNGLGLRGNDSSPIIASDAVLPATALLGGDGKGFDLMMGVVLPWFQSMNAAMSIGVMNAAIDATISHATKARFDHLNQSLAEQPIARANIAKMRVKADLAQTLWLDTVAAITTNRPDTMLRVLEVKLAAAEAALEVTDLGMRVCGGAAFRRELHLERLSRDARAASVMAPTSDALNDFIGKAICGLPLF